VEARQKKRPIEKEIEQEAIGKALYRGTGFQPCRDGRLLFGFIPCGFSLQLLMAWLTGVILVELVKI